jgi:hypothetical protein
LPAAQLGIRSWGSNNCALIFFAGKINTFLISNASSWEWRNEMR